MNQYILLDTAVPIATITLNRPERHNSLIPELLQQLLDALEAVAARITVFVSALASVMYPSRLPASAVASRIRATSRSSRT